MVSCTNATQTPKLQNTLAVAELDAGNYDAIFLPGGHGPMWDFSQSTTLANLIEAFDEEEKVIASPGCTWSHEPYIFANLAWLSTI